ncbi:DNA repair protein RecN [Acidovorax lacteus]|uniref:DNA repair protein RecN n=1 Tax=Acidovorax lacteus TaxID=1924988 RepID=A0ABP8L7P6_9BURK
MIVALRRIELRDFVIVERLSLELQPGFTALTGETGAGKSILIDALQLALGARADAGVVRDGAERADIAAEFDTPTGLAPWLEDAGFDRTETTLVRRSIDRQGRSRAWINGSAATAAQLRELGEQMLDVHGQHAWQSLVRPDAIAALLDAYAKVSTTEVQQAWRAWRLAERTLQEARQSQEHLQIERERLQWQIKDMEKLAPRLDEWDELHNVHQRLLNAQGLLDTAQQAHAALAGDESAGARYSLHQARTLLDHYRSVEPEFSGLLDLLDSATVQVDEVVRSLQSYSRHVELDPARLEELDNRVAQWLSLSRRYRREPQELPMLLEQWRVELARLDSAVDLEGLQREAQRTENRYRDAAKRISQQRKKAVPALSRDVTLAMQELGMPGGVFTVTLEAAETPTSMGLDAIGFLVAGHPGATPRPISKVASGGELSRISLAIAVTTSQLGSIPTLIFDEVDSGVGGAVADTVGKLLRRLGEDRQVLAVTHLPQVAARAHHHLLVEKSRGKTTTSQVRPLPTADRVRELARMLGGEKITDTSLAHASELLDAAALIQGTP